MVSFISKYYLYSTYEVSVAKGSKLRDIFVDNTKANRARLKISK